MNIERLVRAIGLGAAAATMACAPAPAPEQPNEPARPVSKASASTEPVAAPGPSSEPAPITTAEPAPITEAAPPPAAAPEAPGKLCVVLYDETPQGRADERFGYVDDAGRLTWIVWNGGAARSKLLWDEDRIVKIERHDANGPSGGGVGFTYGSNGELVRMTHLPSRVWWEATYEGTFGKKKQKREPRWIHTVLKAMTFWPPHLPFQDGLTQPVFTGKLVARYGQPHAYEIRCKLGGEGAGRCDDDYERVDTLRGFRLFKREGVKEDVTKEKSRDYQYQGDRLVKIENRDTAGNVVYRSSFDYDDKGRVVRVHMTDFGSTNITERLEYRCDVAN